MKLLFLNNSFYLNMKSSDFKSGFLQIASSEFTEVLVYYCAFSKMLKSSVITDPWNFHENKYS